MLLKRSSSNNSFAFMNSTRRPYNIESMCMRTHVCVFTCSHVEEEIAKHVITQAHDCELQWAAILRVFLQILLF